MPLGNRVDRDCNIIPIGNDADFHLVSYHERVCRTILLGGQANERSISNVCSLRLRGGLALY